MTTDVPHGNPRLPIHAAHGTELTAKSWQTEAPLRMLMNNLDPDNAENPADLVVYGGTGQAARSWEAYDAIVRSLRDLEDDETLLVQSGKPVGIMRTHAWAPRVRSTCARRSSRRRRPLPSYACCAPPASRAPAPTATSHPRSRPPWSWCAPGRS